MVNGHKTSPSLRAGSMSVGTAFVLLQMSADGPVVFGCAEDVAKRLCRPTTGAPAFAVETKTDKWFPQFTLTDYGVLVKEKLEKWVQLR